LTTSGPWRRKKSSHVRLICVGAPKSNKSKLHKKISLK
jgi:hypothetical protein